MTNEEIQKAAVEKAVSNGFDPRSGADRVRIRAYTNENVLELNWYREIILNPEFAQAFWGG